MKKNRQTRIKDNLEIRFKILQSIRHFFSSNGYIEVETPCRIPAPAPEAHIEAPASGDWFLRSSPELCMKRLLAAGFPRIFQICKCFREKERGDRHTPEFTILEWYTKGANYLDMMTQSEEMILAAAQGTGFSGSQIVRRGAIIDIAPPWPRMTVSEAFKQFASMTMEEALEQNLFDETLTDEIEPRLGKTKPVFLCDYPASMGSLARLRPDNPEVAERFELYMDGMELCNAFTELTDPREQEDRFREEMAIRENAGKIVYPMPKKFLNDLEFMPDAAGNALGIDRLAMILTDAEKIDDVSAFVPEEL